jgi:hypothetical protein
MERLLQAIFPCARYVSESRTRKKAIDLEIFEATMSVVKSRRLQEQLEQLRLRAELDHVKQEQSILFQVPAEIRNTSKENPVSKLLTTAKHCTSESVSTAAHTLSSPIGFFVKVDVQNID